jgi:transposase
VLHIFSPDVLAMIATNRPGWECMVPDGVAKVIREQRLFGSAHLA